jgi:germination protein M
MLQRKSIKLAIVFTIIALMTAGCIFGPEQAKIDPPQATGLGTEAPVEATETLANESIRTTLYFYDEKGNVTPLSMNLPKTPGIAKEALSYMVKGGQGEAVLPSGFSAVLPEGTVINEINITSEKTAIVDFSKEFANYDESQELSMLQAITWTLTEFPTVERVELRMEGRALKTMPVAKTPLDRPLSRSMGINLEMADHVNVGDTMAITLYFQGSNSAGDYSYFVPVTRLVPRSQDVALTTLEQLVRGPKQGSSLVSAVLPSTQIEQVGITGDTITANFNRDLLLFNEEGRASGDAVKSIVLSLTENTGAQKVQIMVEGESQIVTEEQSLETPVLRPQEINATSF